MEPHGRGLYGTTATIAVAHIVGGPDRPLADHDGVICSAVALSRRSWMARDYYAEARALAGKLADEGCGTWALGKLLS